MFVGSESPAERHQFGHRRQDERFLAGSATTRTLSASSRAKDVWRPRAAMGPMPDRGRSPLVGDPRHDDEVVAAWTILDQDDDGAASVQLFAEEIDGTYKTKCLPAATLHCVHQRLCGDSAQAEKLAAETSKVSPNGTIWNAVHRPEIHAAIELWLNHPANAVELLASASPYERAYPEVVYLRGLAYLRLKKGAEAAAEFQKIQDHKGASWGSTWLHPNWGQYYSLSYLGLARAFAIAGDAAKARKAFQEFFAVCDRTERDQHLNGKLGKRFGAVPSLIPLGNLERRTAVMTIAKSRPHSFGLSPMHDVASPRSSTRGSRGPTHLPPIALR